MWSDRVLWEAVPFPIDVSKPFRYPSELKRLVQAVRAAGEYDETRWIEWKRSLDLTGAEGIRHIARQILGFANREPRVAAQWAGGYAYLVVGASPEALIGVTQLDHEQLVSKIGPYVGSYVTWTPEYIEIDGVIALVITMDPPHLGDDIHVLRKDLDRYKAGTVFIRRHGQTIQADADEMAMLQRRLLARARQLEFAVEPVVSAMETMPDFQGPIDRWASVERFRMVATRYQTEPSAAYFAESRDDRTVEQYEDEIDTYLAKAKQALRDRGLWSLARHRPAMLALQLLNRGVRNYTQVGVILTIKSDVVRGYDGILLELINNDEPLLPEPPNPLGAPHAGSSKWDSGLPAHMSVRPTLSEIVPNITGLRREGQTSNIIERVTIEFDPCDLRPHRVVKLPAVPLVVAAAPGTTFSVEWTATATNFDGEITGACAISVSESTLGDGWTT